ncbi:hypothetical protein RvY_00544 [Ramazzottius varieornatus]|uniref:Cdc23 domain-containing protein n=1 Tax=Ramazzottius varieornatus TaxID=947166 RepID=A0A1D1UD57_RAMVA|nr:hypothetical protein RvY_00544 [Ramazzottius varieornatus]
MADLSTSQLSEMDLSTASSLPSPTEEFILPLVLRQFPYSTIKNDVTRCMVWSSRLCFFQSQRWAAELLRPMEKIKGKAKSPLAESDVELFSSVNHPLFFVIISAMQRYQYGEALGYLKSPEYEEDAKKNHLFRFLSFYCRFLHGQSLAIQTADNPLEFSPTTEKDVKHLQILREQIKEEKLINGLDSLMKYMYAVVLRQLDSFDMACDLLAEAITEQPFMWCFWFELSDCLRSTDQLTTLLTRLPLHWMRDFFLGRAYHLLNMPEEAYQTYKYLRKSLFSSTPYVLGEMAKVCYGRRETQEAFKLMEKIRASEPFRLDDMDFYSVVLYARGDKGRLGKLSRELHDIDPFTPETHIVIGNYYSLLEQSDRAIEHYSKALRANSENQTAWLNLGYEYMGLKNYTRATSSFQKVVELNPLDLRAWISLGKVAEAEHKRPEAALYFFKATQVSPADPRGWKALGNVCELMEKMEDAMKAYWQAYLCGEKEEPVLVKLGKLYEKANQKKSALTVYEKYVESCEEMVANAKGKEDLGRSGYLSELMFVMQFITLEYKDEGREDDAMALEKQVERLKNGNDGKKKAAEVLTPGKSFNESVSMDLSTDEQ